MDNRENRRDSQEWTIEKTEGTVKNGLLRKLKGQSRMDYRGN